MPFPSALGNVKNVVQDKSLHGSFIGRSGYGFDFARRAPKKRLWCSVSRRVALHTQKRKRPEASDTCWMYFISLPKPDNMPRVTLSLLFLVWHVILWMGRMVARLPGCASPVRNVTGTPLGSERIPKTTGFFYHVKLEFNQSCSLNCLWEHYNVFIERKYCEDAKNASDCEINTI